MAAALALLAIGTARASSGQANGTLDRSRLPIAEPTPAPIREMDVQRATPPVRFQVTAPPGAPNVVIVLLDDMGFGQPATFGGAVAMPTLDRLAAEGVRYANFHVTAMCSPTRAALLTGRNHHTANTGAVQDGATAFPGNTGIRPLSVATLPEMLRLNGYNTAAFGKWHLTPLWETSVSGPYTTWPTGSGFEQFYGFLGGETNQWSPLLYDGVTPVELPADPNYHFMTDMTNRAIGWVRAQQTMTPGRPFFMYFAPGSTHAPHHVPGTWTEQYRGKFDAGWDQYRIEALARQLQLGIVPAGTVLAPKPPFIRDWSSLSSDERRLVARQMEVFAGYAEQADYEVGRLVGALQQLGVMDNTLFIYIAGDNGASAEGGANGTVNELTYFNGVQLPVADQLGALAAWGSASTYPHYAAGWAVAGNAPFAYAKQVGGDWGGSINGMVVRWPKHTTASPEVRRQFTHVTDVAPTVLEAAGLPFPVEVDGIAQQPFAGTSLAFTFTQPAAPERHTTQYFEILGSRGIYHDGWFARTIHKAPWEAQPRASFEQDSWNLYDTKTDFSLATDVASRYPDRLAELKALFATEALKYHVFPLDDRSLERLDPAVAGRPDLMQGRSSLTVYPGMQGMMENTFINVKNRSSTVTAEVDIPAGGANGVLLAQGGRFGGWSLYLVNGRPTYTYNWVGLAQYTVSATDPLPAGRATIGLHFTYDGGGRGNGGTATLSVNGRRVAEGRVERTTPFMFSLDEGADVGVDEDTPVAEAYAAGPGSRFTGTIHQVTVQVE